MFLMIMACGLAAVPMAGCSGQQTTQPPAEVAQEAPPPPPAADTQAPPPAPAPQAAAPAPRPASRPTNHASAIPEERPMAPAPAAPQTVTLTIPAGTPMSLGFSGGLTSETAMPGDGVVGTLKEAIAVGDRIVFPAGSEVRGTITDVKSASKGFKETGGALTIQFGSIVSPNGHKAIIAAGYTKVAEGSAAKKGAIIGGSAVGGALLGKVLGKSTAGGAAVGAAVGTAVAGTTKGREAVVKPEDVVQVALEQNAKVTLPR